MSHFRGLLSALMSTFILSNLIYSESPVHLLLFTHKVQWFYTSHSFHVNRGSFVLEQQYWFIKQELNVTPSSDAAGMLSSVLFSGLATVSVTRSPASVHLITLQFSPWPRCTRDKYRLLEDFKGSFESVLNKKILQSLSRQPVKLRALACWSADLQVTISPSFRWSLP